MWLTDAQLDVVTSGVGQAAVDPVVQIENSVRESFTLLSKTNSAFASIASGFVNIPQPGVTSFLSLGASAVALSPF